jgi:hypothetical protein
MDAARDHLAPWVEQLATLVQVRFARVRIGCQRTRWGSYSTRGTVSLNAGLLFLPAELTRYVLLHELCHVAQPNHSPAFWSLLEQHAPDARQLRDRLRSSHGVAPRWLYLRPEVPPTSACRSSPVRVVHRILPPTVAA